MTSKKGVSMFNLLFAIVSITSIVLLKFDFYFRDFIFNDNRVLTGLIIALGAFLFIKFNDFILGVFAVNNGPFGKFVHSTILLTVSLLLILMPFDTMHEFRVRFTLGCVVMSIPLYFVFKKFYKINQENYSFIDLMNSQLKMVIESSIFTAFLASLFLVYVDSKDGHYNALILSTCLYFASVVGVSIWTKFNISRNIIVNSFSFYIAFFFIIFGSYEQAKHTEWFLLAGCGLLIFSTLYDIVMIGRYIYNPVKFLKSCQIPEWAQTVFSVRRDSSINYFKYFKNIKVGKVFIHYDSLLGRIDCIIKDDYVVLKQLNYNSIPEDKLFHIKHKEISQSLFSDFFNMSNKFIDEHSNIDKYAIFHLGTIKQYMESNSMSYNELSDDDLKVLEMFEY
jgi:hypothetical protein